MAASGARVLRVLIVDDEDLARSNLRSLLKAEPGISIVAECADGIEALEALPRLQPDVLFIDVEMPGCDGFEVIERLAPHLPPAIIFVTAYDAYAVRAFEAGALDYLLKPFDGARLCLALDRARLQVAVGRNAPGHTSLAVKHRGSLVFLALADIDWIEAADYNVRVHAGAKVFQLRRTMNDIEATVGMSDFCRIHRASVVRLDRIRSVELAEHGEYDVVLLDGTRLPTSRRYRKSLMARLLPSSRSDPR